MTRERALRVLDLPAACATAEVRLAYRDLVRVWHPDRFEGDGRLRAKAGLRLAEINVAYRLLTGEAAPARRPAARSRPHQSGATAPRPSGAASTHPTRAARGSWTGVAASAALIFGIACVALALMLSSTPVV